MLKQSYTIFQEPSDCFLNKVKALPSGSALIVPPPAFGVNFNVYLHRVNPTTEGNQWNPEMAIDSSGRLHIAYYDEQQEHYRPYYRTVNFTGVERNTPVFGDPIVIANTNTSSSFFRPGEYFSIQLDQDGIPHVTWSDGRNDEMDIYYAHGLATESTPELIPAEVVIALVGVSLLVVIVVLAYAKKR